jgi:hypothetical protein
MIRIEMVEHIPSIAEWSHNHCLLNDADVVSEHLLPIILQFLNDPNSQVNVLRMFDIIKLLFNCRMGAKVGKAYSH